MKFFYPVAIGVLGCLLSGQLGCSPAEEAQSAKQVDAPVNSGPQLEVSFAANAPPATEKTAGAPAVEPARAVDVEVSPIDYAGLLDFIGKQSGHVVVVDVWSTSCVPCMREFPQLVALHKSARDRLVCVSLNVDYIGLKKRSPESYLPKVQDFLAAQESTLTNFLSTQPDETIREKLGISAIPAILVFGPNGEIAHTLTDGNAGDDGLTYASDVIPAVDGLLDALP